MGIERVQYVDLVLWVRVTKRCESKVFKKGNQSLKAERKQGFAVGGAENL